MVDERKPSTFYVVPSTGGLWKTIEQRDDVRVGAARQEHGVDRPRGAGAVQPGHRLGGHRRRRVGPHPDPRLRRLEVDRRGQDVGAHGPHRDAPHRPHRDRPAQPRHRLRGGRRLPLLERPRPRPLQDDRRRQDVGEGALQGRPRRRRGRRHRPEEARHRVRGDLRQAAHPVELRRGRPRDRDLPVEGRGEDVAAAGGRAADRASSRGAAWRSTRRSPSIMYAVIDNQNPRQAPAARRAGAGRAAPARRAAARRSAARSTVRTTAATRG